jgi:hypothetical protein
MMGQERVTTRRARTSAPFALAALASLMAAASIVACSGANAQIDAAGTPVADAPTSEPDAPRTGEPSAPNPAPPGSPTPTPGPGPAPTTTTPAIPNGLACLAKHYVGQATSTTGPAGGFALVLPDGTRLPWDDGQTKTYEQKLEGPDLEDTLAMPYKAGPVVPVNTLNDDPGRVRSDAMFKAAFGATAVAVEAKLIDVTFVGQKVKFHSRAAAALGKVSTRLQQAIAGDATLASYVTGALGGTYEWRPIANTTRMSAHSYGIAIDIVVSKSNYWEWEKQGATFTWKNKIPQAIVDAFEAEGFAWGGRWYHYDTMHFEYRPELFDPACK